MIQLLQIYQSQVLEFSTFENVGVAATKPGYIKIKDEIIKYTGFSGDTLTGITRQQDSTLGQNYVTGDLVLNMN